MYTAKARMFSPIQLYSELVGVSYSFILLAAGTAMLQRILTNVYTMIDATSTQTVNIIEAVADKITA
jgi:hypothetical protein